MDTCHIYSCSLLPGQLHDGRDVALKIQHRGIDSIIAQVRRAVSVDVKKLQIHH